jgi:DNA-binding NarL/FixJ family response regulator
MMTRVVIADDHEIVRDGIQMIIASLDDMEVVGTASNGREAVALATELQPDVVVMDIAMPLLNGLDALELIKAAHPGIKVILLSMHNTADYVRKAVKSDAAGYILKQSAGVELIKAIRTVVRGHRYFGKGVAESIEPDAAGQNSDEHQQLLSQRELEVLKKVVEGKTSAEIAETLFLSPKTVETYRHRIMKKLNVDNIPMLVRYAIRHGILAE